MSRASLLGLGVVAVVAVALLLALGPDEVTDPAAGALARDAADQAERQAAAESRPAITTTAPAGAETTTAAAPLELSSSELHEAAMDFVAAPDPTMLVPLLVAMGETGDPRWVPYILDLRLYATAEVFLTGQHALRQITGDPGPEDLVAAHRYYGRWMYDHAINPGTDYIDFKATLYAAIDNRFAALLRQIDDPALVAQVQWGGVLVGGIPELNDERTIAIAAADYMKPDELTFGAVVNGAARSYPHRILDHHELANDTLGGEPVALVNCTLCRTGVLYSRRVGNAVLDFQTSGLLWNSNKVMMDRQTGSLWEQLTGVAFAGDYTGTVLDRFPLTVTQYADWTAEHPESDVVAIPADGRYSYQPGDAYATYYSSDVLWFPTFSVPDSIREKAEVATLDWNGARLAVELSALAERGPQILEVGDGSVVAVPTNGGARFYSAGDTPVVESDLGGVRADEATLVLADGTQLERLVSGHSFWFAWFGAFPDTAWWPSN
jgi:hypothetical protein